MKFKNIYYFLLMFTVQFSCQKSTENWLKSYQETKCLYSKTEEKLQEKTTKTTIKETSELAEIEKELLKIEAPFQNKTQAIDKKIEQTNQKFQSEYRQITDAHSLKFGHQTTPEFEKKIADNNQNQVKAIAILQSQKTRIKAEMVAFISKNELNAKKKELLASIENAKNLAKGEFQDKIDSLQKVLDTKNLEFKAMVADLKAPQKKAFIQQRDLIKKSPCK